MQNIARRTGIFLCAAMLLAGAATHALADVVKLPVKKKVEVAFVLDTTGSMGSLIDGAKKKIWSIANTIVDQYPDAEIRFGLVGYRDIDDAYVTKHFKLTTDIQGIYAHLLAFEAEGGGDTPESVNEALDVAVTKLAWTDKSQVKADRILFLVGDAPPHMDYKQDRKYPVVLKEAVQKGIVVNAVQAGDSTQTKEIWKKIAAAGKGDYLSIPQDGGTVRVIETPFDGKIRTIQIQLNTTVIVYGNKKDQKVTEDKAKLYERAAPVASAEMSSFVNKSGKGSAVVTGRGDLVADVNKGEQILERVQEDELPEAMQSMNLEERRQHIADITKKREKLSRELADVVTQRDAYIKKEQASKPAEQADSFDRSVVKTLTKQIQ